MKKLLILLLLGCMFGVSAAGPRYHRHPRSHHRPPQRVSIVRKVPWQTVAAGGAAAGAIVAAYKISNGVESGLKSSAQSRPDLFLQYVNPWSLPFKLLLGGGIVIVLYYLFRKGVTHETSQK